LGTVSDIRVSDFSEDAYKFWSTIKPNPYLASASSCLKYAPPMPKNIIFNNPATIVYWDDGTKTVVKIMEGDEFDEILGVSMAYTKKLFGSNAIFKRMVKSFIPLVPEEPKEVKEPEVTEEPKEQVQEPTNIGTVNEDTIILNG
jgi:hypothetical protein